MPNQSYYRFYCVSPRGGFVGVEEAHCETDEFQRTVQIESSLWATGGVMVLCAGWGFLEMFRLVPHMEAWVLVPVWALLLGFANVFIRRRYR